MTRVAAIDCGTNSIRLLVADVEDDLLVDVVRRMEIVRLGEGVDRAGRLAQAALGRTFAALDDYVAEIARHSVERVRMVATSATRDAANRSEFVDGVVARLGVEPEVVTGDEEAALSFDGATRELRAGRRGFVPPYLVCDIGGGSTELVLGDRSGMQSARSVDVGCVRLTERHLRDDPPTARQIDAARTDVRRAVDLARETVDVDAAQTFVGLAGSVTTVVAIALGLDRYRPERIHHARVDAAAVSQVASTLLAMTHEERAALPVMHPGRVDVIGAGALVLDTILAEVGADAVVASEHDILDGIAFSALSAT